MEYLAINLADNINEEQAEIEISHTIANYKFLNRREIVNKYSKIEIKYIYIFSIIIIINGIVLFSINKNIQDTKIGQIVKKISFLKKMGVSNREILYNYILNKLARLWISYGSALVLILVYHFIRRYLLVKGGFEVIHKVIMKILLYDIGERIPWKSFIIIGIIVTIACYIEALVAMKKILKKVENVI